MKNAVKLSFFAAFFLGLLNAPAQSRDYDKTRAEIQEVLGTVPSFLEAVPKDMLPMAWNHFNSSSNTNNKIPAKYIELIKVAVASQIPCHYCIYAHKVNAALAGASEEEIKEAVMHAAWVRHWSTLAQSTTVDFEAFKKEYQGIVEYMAKQGKN